MDNNIYNASAQLANEVAEKMMMLSDDPKVLISASAMVCAGFATQAGMDTQQVVMLMQYTLAKARELRQQHGH